MNITRVISSFWQMNLFILSGVTTNESVSAPAQPDHQSKQSPKGSAHWPITGVNNHPKEVHIGATNFFFLSTPFVFEL